MLASLSNFTPYLVSFQEDKKGDSRKGSIYAGVQLAAPAVQPIAFHDSVELLATVQIVDRILNDLGHENNKATGVITSRCPGFIAAKPELANLVSPSFEGVKRWVVPMAAITPRTLDAKEIGALKVVVSGSIERGGGNHSLTQGDWVWLPAGGEYSFRAEESGAVLFTILPCVADTTDVGEKVGLLNKLVDGTFITPRDAYIKALEIKLDHLEYHF
ncbi:hypothetical protein TruAng_011368 [Truncatella angustata]|nr:hypothetical protein TruAng_011368 [Truncatella angustata]